MYPQIFMEPAEGISRRTVVIPGHITENILTGTTSCRTDSEIHLEQAECILGVVNCLSSFISQRQSIPLIQDVELQNQLYRSSLYSDPKNLSSSKESSVTTCSHHSFISFNHIRATVGTYIRGAHRNTATSIDGAHLPYPAVGA